MVVDKNVGVLVLLNIMYFCYYLRNFVYCFFDLVEYLFKKGVYIFNSIMLVKLYLEI